MRKPRYIPPHCYTCGGWGHKRCEEYNATKKEDRTEAENARDHSAGCGSKQTQASSLEQRQEVSIQQAHARDAQAYLEEGTERKS